MLVLLMSAKEISQKAFNVFSMVSASLMFFVDGPGAIVVVVNIDAVFECAEFRETASAALCYFPRQYR